MCPYILIYLYSSKGRNLCSRASCITLLFRRVVVCIVCIFLACFSSLFMASLFVVFEKETVFSEQDSIKFEICLKACSEVDDKTA